MCKELRVKNAFFDGFKDGWKHKISNWFLLRFLGLQRKLKVMYATIRKMHWNFKTLCYRTPHFRDSINILYCYFRNCLRIFQSCFLSSKSYICLWYLYERISISIFVLHFCALLWGFLHLGNLRISEEEKAFP